MLPPDTRAWILTDGKPGDENQCAGVAQALGLTPQIRRVAPRAPFTWLMPRGPVDPAEAPGRPGSPIAPPFPDILIASGRRAVPYVRAVKKASRGRAFTVFLKDPRTGTTAADLIWVPAHDRLRGANVIVTDVSPHLVSQARLGAARAAPPSELIGLPEPRAAVLVGGDSAHYRFTEADIEAFVAGLARLARSGVSLMGSASRRTPPKLAVRARAVIEEAGGFFWDGRGDNPYIALLALADAVVVTADSVNMVGEATATGRPVLVFEPKGGHRKIGAFLNRLMDGGFVHRFDGRLAGTAYVPLDSTQSIAEAVARAYRTHRQAQGYS
jgi:mitochondrial fission protein ELM1